MEMLWKKWVRRIKLIVVKKIFLLLNFYSFIKLGRIQTFSKNNIQISGLTLDKINEYTHIYEELNYPTKIDFLKKIILKTIGKKCCFIARDLDSNNIIAISLFYFNLKDFYEHSIHEGFIGVIKNYQGRGIATMLRAYTLSHFSNFKIKAISTIIDTNNPASLNSAKKLGFKIQEKYIDNCSNSEKYYLKCNLFSDKSTAS